jgi:hypothetical protein
VNPPAQAIAAADFIELQRTECYGTCPTYTVRVQGNGQVTWSGQAFVRVVGPSTASVEPEKAQALIEKARTNGFWNLCRDYKANVTDAPTFYTTVRIAAQQKRVSDYFNMAPIWLRELEREIDEVANTYHWIHGEPSSNIFAFVMRSDPSAPPVRYAPVPGKAGRGLLVSPITLFSEILESAKPGLTQLMRASGRADLSEVQRLLAANPDPNAQDSSGWTALMYATSARNNTPSLEVVRALLAAGENPNRKSAMGQTATMAASTALYARAGMLRLIAGGGGDIHAQDKNGHTALMFAATGIYGITTLSDTDNRYTDYADALSFLIAAGARIDPVDLNGFTVLDQLDHLSKANPARSAIYEKVRVILTQR